MTKLEEKLIELGYEEDLFRCVFLKKKYRNYELVIVIYGTKITRITINSLGYSADVGIMEKALKEMQKDLEELKNVED